MESSGFVYVMSCKAMPGLVKVGFTRRTPQERAAELSHGEQLPHPVIVEFSVQVPCPEGVERVVHLRLRPKRENKEWFRCSAKEAYAVIMKVAGPTLREEPLGEEAERLSRLKAQSEEARLQRQRMDEEVERIRRAKYAIEAKYTSQLAALTKMPHFLFFWLMGVAVLAMVFSMLSPASNKNSDAMLFLSFLLGIFPAMVMHSWVARHKENNPRYRQLIAQREAELAALESENEKPGAPAASTLKPRPTFEALEPPVFNAGVTQHVSLSNRREVEKLQKVR